jgi:hypothetical protein
MIISKTPLRAIKAFQIVQGELQEVEVGTLDMLHPHTRLSASMTPFHLLDIIDRAAKQGKSLAAFECARGPIRHLYDAALPQEIHVMRRDTKLVYDT